MLLLATALAGPFSPQASLVLTGTRSATLDLYRPWADADKVLVAVGLPDGSEELFIVDTGAATSVLSESVARRLNLDPTEDAGFLQGLSGTVPWIRTSVPRIDLGGFQLHAVDMAIGVAGVPEMMGALPIGGILGNNVWSNFVCVVDYPRDTMELHLAGEVRVPKRAAPLAWDGRSALTPVRITAELDGARVRETVVLEVDTGAHDILFLGDTGEPFRAVTTTGEEPILGIGANLDELPDRLLLQPTRRAQAQDIRAGGRTYALDAPVRWLCADGGCGEQPLLPGLLGYVALQDQRVLIDFPGGRFALTRSRGAPRDLDGNAAWLARERIRATPERAAIRTRLAWAADDPAGARTELSAGLAARPDDPELVVLSAWMDRRDGQFAQSLATLGGLSPQDLAEQGEWVAYINGLTLAGRGTEALRLAQVALAVAVPEGKEELLVALSDALLANDRPGEASAALEEAGRVSPKGGAAHLVRKARIASVIGDRYGAIVALRELMENIPLEGVPFWLYASLTTPLDVPTYLADVERSLARLHPGTEPWDFVGAGWYAVGDTERAWLALDSGEARDCTPMPAGAHRDNCRAWYLALGRRDLDEATALIDSALRTEPTNPSFLDTAAVVAWAAGRTDDAATHARSAAMQRPDDPYLLWQLTRVEGRVDTGSAPPSPHVPG